MVHVKSEKEIDLMRESCKIVKETLEFVGSRICVGMSAKEVDELVERYIRSCVRCNTSYAEPCADLSCFYQPWTSGVLARLGLARYA